MTPKERNPLTLISSMLSHSMEASNVTGLLQTERVVSTGNVHCEYIIGLPVDGIPSPTYATVNGVPQSSVSYDMTIKQCHQVDTGTLKIASLDKQGTLVNTGPEPGYDMTARQDDELDAFDEIMLGEPEHGFRTHDYDNTEQSCSYKDLIACNGCFRLPLALVDANEEEDTWSRAAIICDKDQEDLQEALKEASWT
ncbi:hypothetical protein BKA65DRAFT_209693 [Rhexocercosporidium sp. MPI-PUGE-AT-0058]|nr:hypothetical protein BKA65DRAFT_209693 [Rhexocercosporidium sp. MPI-PUGE-AT-0058]